MSKKQMEDELYGITRKAQAYREMYFLHKEEKMNKIKSKQDAGFRLGLARERWQEIMDIDGRAQNILNAIKELEDKHGITPLKIDIKALKKERDVLVGKVGEIIMAADMLPFDGE